MEGEEDHSPFSMWPFTLTAFVLEKIGWKGVITIILHSTAIIVGGYYPAKMAFYALKTLTLNIRTLMVTGAVGAVTLGLWEEAATLVFYLFVR